MKIEDVEKINDDLIGLGTKNNPIIIDPDVTNAYSYIKGKYTEI